MSGSTLVIDARGLPCPQPVILTKKALEEGAAGRIEVLVDNEAARENVLRFAGFSGRPAEAQSAEDVNTEATPGETRPDRIATVFIPTDRLGHGDDELGALLMRGFIYALAESGEKPSLIILMNGGVRLVVEGSECLANFRRLAQDGAEILVCGTCLDFFKLKDKLAVGRVSNMYEITEQLMKGKVLRP
jgi:selenium metabolism protein YedF